MKYREKNSDPIRLEEIQALNAAIANAGFKFPELHHPAFLATLQVEPPPRPADSVTEPAPPPPPKLSTSETRLRLADLRDQYYGLWSMKNRQEAGYTLERVLRGLMALCGLEPHKPFRVVGEQVDGSFDLDREIYLFEAKCVAGQIPEAELLVFRGKIEGKSQFTRGVFFALNGFTCEARDAITRGKQPSFFLVDGHDLSVVVEGGMPLDEMFRAKLRYLAEEGKVFVSVKEFFTP